MKNIRKIIIVSIISLLISTSITTSFAFQKYDNIKLNQKRSINCIAENETIATCYLYQPEGTTSIDNVISYDTGSILVELFKESNDDLSKREELIDSLIDLGFIQDKLFNPKNPSWLNKIYQC